MTDNGVLAGKQIVLAVSGGIAAYKSVELLRLIQKCDAHVRVIMTQNAAKFVGPVTFEALSGRPVYQDMFDHADPGAIQHIEWAQAADAVVIAPATANIIAKMAGGIADDALSTFLLAVNAPILVCPAMNSHMMAHPATQRNLAQLAADGCHIIEPDAGQLACGASGRGRLPDPTFIADRLQKALTSQDMAGRRVVVTAGPTREPIDAVRFISNPSSGKMGFALARAAEHRGASVMLISGPTHLAAPAGVELMRVETALQMADAVLDHARRADVIIKAAAVSDFRPAITTDRKIKKHDAQLTLALKRNPDILKALGRQKGQCLLIGFAAETDDIEGYARQKLAAKNLDMIVANRIGGPESAFQADVNQVALLRPGCDTEVLPKMEKFALAHQIWNRVVTIAGNSWRR